MTSHPSTQKSESVLGQAEDDSDVGSSILHDKYCAWLLDFHKYHNQKKPSRAIPILSRLKVEKKRKARIELVAAGILDSFVKKL